MPVLSGPHASPPNQNKVTGSLDAGESSSFFLLAEVFSRILPVCIVENFWAFFPQASSHVESPWKTVRPFPDFRFEQAMYFLLGGEVLRTYILNPARLDPAIVFQQWLHLHICESPWKTRYPNTNRARGVLHRS